MHVATRDLPEVLQRILKARGYNKRDVSVEPKERVGLSGASGSGQRCYAVIVNLSTGQHQTHMGSWGGPNVFNPTNRVDLDDSQHVIPLNGAVVKGSEGHYSYASIYVHPDNFQKLLPPKPEVSEIERSVLRVYRQYKAAYRKEYLARIPGYTEAIELLVSRGMLKRNKAGATSITTDGKNAI